MTQLPPVHGLSVDGLVPLVDSFELPYQNEDRSDTFWTVYDLTEAEREERGIVDQKYVLARAVGPMCVLNGTSRNNRYYSEELWESAFEKTKQVCGEGLMLGTIGHDLKLDDAALRAGHVSHYVTKLWLDKPHKVGMGEVLVLNTPTGRNLNTYLRGGSQLRVSSRAFGEYEGKEGGADRVNPKTFVLETFDFVWHAGIDKAIPRVVEAEPARTVFVPPTIQAQVDDPPAPKPERRRPMAEEVTKQMMEDWRREKSQMEADLKSALATNAEQAAELKLIKKSVDEATTENQSLKDKLSQTEEQLSTAQAEVADYRKLGTTDKIEEAFVQTDAHAQKLKPFGSTDEIVARIQLADTYEQMGTTEQIQEVFQLTKQYTELGTVEELEQVLDVAEAYAELATPDEVKQMMAHLEKYSELGSPEQIEAAFDQSLGLIEARKKDVIESRAAQLSDETGVSETAAQKLLTRLDGNTDEASELIDEIRDGASGVTARYEIGEGKTRTRTKMDRSKGLGRAMEELKREREAIHSKKKKKAEYDDDDMEERKGKKREMGDYDDDDMKDETADEGDDLREDVTERGRRGTTPLSSVTESRVSRLVKQTAA